MINFVELINSRAVREYYKKVPEQFLVAHESWLLLRLVTECRNTTFEEKLQDLEELYQYDDGHCCIRNLEGKYTFSQRLDTVIALWKERQQCFFDDADAAYYTIHIDVGIYDIVRDGDSFKSLVDALDTVEELMDEYLSDEGNIRVWIDKIYLDNEHRMISAMYQEPGHKLIKLCEPWDDELNDVKMAQPVILCHPFHRGDILRYEDPDDSRNDKVFVLDNIEIPETNENRIINFTGEIFRPLVWGYFIDERNNIIYDALWSNSNADLEYYDGELSYYDKYLGVLSRMIKGESIEGDEFLLAKEACMEAEISTRDNIRKLNCETEKASNPRYKMYLDSSFARFAEGIRRSATDE